MSEIGVLLISFSLCLIINYILKVIWITGLSGSGKSTLAREVVNILREKGNTVILLDGDELREVFGAVNQN